MKPSQIRKRWGRIEDFVTDDPAGTDDTEYAVLSGLLLARHGSALTPAAVETAWHEWIADRDEGPFKGAGFSERGTLENLRRGLAAPITAQHRHTWSDGLAMRAAPCGVFAAGRPAEAARLVAIDGTVSHEGEGIYGGQAVAAGVAAAMGGGDCAAVITAALSVVPEDSWTARSLRRAVTVAGRVRLDAALTVVARERALRAAVVIGGYPWTDLAPEAVGLAFGAFALAAGDFTGAVLSAVNMGRDADTTAAVAGALAGTLGGWSAIPERWSKAVTEVRGSCLPAMAGYHVVDIADLLCPDPSADHQRTAASAVRAAPQRAPAAPEGPRAEHDTAAQPGRPRTDDPPPVGPAEPPGPPGRTTPTEPDALREPALPAGPGSLPEPTDTLRAPATPVEPGALPEPAMPDEPGPLPEPTDTPRAPATPVEPGALPEPAMPAGPGAGPGPAALRGAAARREPAAAPEAGQAGGAGAGAGKAVLS
jgi:ADP-ribosylglycohydrolase